MPLFGGLEQLAQAAGAPGFLGAELAAILPTDITPPQQNQQGAETSWDEFRTYFGATLPAQHGMLAVLRDRFRGIG